MENQISTHLLQYIMTAGCVPCNEVSKILRETTGHTNHSETNLDDIINLINSQITKYGQQIRKVTCEHTGVKYYAFLNIENAMNKFQWQFKTRDIKLIKLIIDEIISNENHKVKKIICVYLNSKVNEPYRVSQAEQVIQQLICQGYLHEENEDLALGVRCIYECEPYLRNAYAHQIADCILCKEAVYTGTTCNKCNYLIHSHCLNHYLSKRKKCPNCKLDWNQGPNSAQNEHLPNKKQRTSS